MDPTTFINRRSFLNQATVGIGSTALAGMLSANALANPKAWPANLPGRAALPGLPKAKRVIFLCMAGGPSHLETYDFKPKLREMDGKPMPKSITEGQPIAQLMGKKNSLKCLGPQHDFQRYGKSGQFISNQFPKIGSIADDICIIRSMHTEQINHDPAHTYMNTGTQISGRPSMGSWILYGLGAPTENPPMAQWLPAQQVPGRALSQQGRSRPLPKQPQGRHGQGPAFPHRLRQQAQPHAQRVPARPRDLH